MGAATAATGGYGSTYAQAAGQQAYDNYLSQLNDKSFDIYDRVYQQYLNEGQELYNRLNAVNNQDNIDYSRYRDSVNDYYNDLNYYAGRYDSSYNQDFGAYQTDLSAQQWAEQYAYQKTQDALAQQNWQTQFDYQKQQDALQLELQRQQLAASLAKKHPEAVEEVKEVVNQARKLLALQRTCLTMWQMRRSSLMRKMVMALIIMTIRM